MSERVTFLDNLGRSATMSPLDERIDPYQSIGWTLRSGTVGDFASTKVLDLLSAANEEQMEPYSILE
jgi:hypothetical protein